MAGFFEQMCKIIAQNEGQQTGIAANSREMAEFFSNISRPQTPEVKPTPEIRQVVEPIRMAPAVPAVPEKISPVIAPPQTSGNFASLEEIANAVKSCQKCPLCQFRKNAVPGEGNPNARLMFIGEGPGADEDIQGRPFVGKAGMLLDKMICAMQFTREEVYIANIVKCRPPDNRAPAPEEVECCIGYLKRQIELIRPEVIVLLGATAVKYLLNVTSGISRLRGRWLSYENIPVMATFHPAFLLRQESAKRDTWNDLQQVMARFGKYHRPGNSGVRQ